jgi:hypothetical protein
MWIMDGKKILVEKMNRRMFLQNLTLLGAGMAAACASKEMASAPTPFRTDTPERVLVSPQVPVTGGQAEETPSGNAVSSVLDQGFVPSEIREVLV